MGITVNIKDLDKITNKLKEITEEVNRAAEKTNKEAPKEAKEMVEYMYRSAVDMYFYEDYDPINYDRTGSLYTACNVKEVNKGIKIELNDDSLGHNGAPGDYIYTLTLVEGYHGGAKCGKKHPNIGVPYWRKGDLDKGWYGWYRPAYKSDNSVVDKFKEEITNYDFKKMTIDIFNKYCKYKIGGM